MWTQTGQSEAWRDAEMTQQQQLEWAGKDVRDKSNDSQQNITLEYKVAQMPSDPSSSQCSGRVAHLLEHIKSIASTVLV